MAQKIRSINQKALFKRAVRTYMPGMSCRQLAVALQVHEFQARQLIHQVRRLAISETN